MCNSLLLYYNFYMAALQVLPVRVSVLRGLLTPKKNGKKHRKAKQNGANIRQGWRNWCADFHFQRSLNGRTSKTPPENDAYCTEHGLA